MRSGTERRRSEQFVTDIQGTLLPVRPDGSPVALRLPGNPSTFVMLFDDAEALRREMDRIHTTDYLIKRVTDGREFVADARACGLRIMLNPYVVNGNTRWTEIAPLGTDLEEIPL